MVWMFVYLAMSVLFTVLAVSYRVAWYTVGGAVAFGLLTVIATINWAVIEMKEYVRIGPSS